jgi:hypothetical protein
VRQRRGKGSRVSNDGERRKVDVECDLMKGKREEGRGKREEGRRLQRGRGRARY